MYIETPDNFSKEAWMEYFMAHYEYFSDLAYEQWYEENFGLMDNLKSFKSTVSQGGRNFKTYLGDMKASKNTVMQRGKQGVQGVKNTLNTIKTPGINSNTKVPTKSQIDNGLDRSVQNATVIGGRAKQLGGNIRNIFNNEKFQSTREKAIGSINKNKHELVNRASNANQFVAKTGQALATKVGLNSRPAGGKKPLSAYKYQPSSKSSYYYW